MHVGLKSTIYIPRRRPAVLEFVIVCIKLVWKTKDGPYVKESWVLSKIETHKMLFLASGLNISQLESSLYILQNVKKFGIFKEDHLGPPPHMR